MKGLKKVVCVDLDGTLCDDSHRHHLTPQIDPSKTWTDYHMACIDDAPIPGAIAAVRALAAQYDIHIISGREEAAHAATVTWLEQYKVPYAALRLRRPEDAQFKKWEYKTRYVESLRSDGLEPVLFVEDWPLIAWQIEEKTGVPVICINSRFPKLYTLPTNRGIRLEGDEYPALTQPQLDDIARRLAAAGPLAGYPPPDKRLYMQDAQIHSQETGIHIPDGPWLVRNHANRRGADAGDAKSSAAAKTADWHKRGFDTDQLGRPLHPYWRQLLDDKRIGLPTGRGIFYHYGPNVMVDAVVYRWHGDRPEFLLVRQKSSGKWGLPGGFVDAQDASIEAAARRETAEETGLEHIGGSTEIMWRTLPIRQRDTLHAWAEVWVVVIHGDQEYLNRVQPEADDDTSDAGWFGLSAIAELDLLDTHTAYLALALPRLRRRYSISEERI